jgi:hypothetical protein
LTVHRRQVVIAETGAALLAVLVSCGAGVAWGAATPTVTISGLDRWILDSLTPAAIIGVGVAMHAMLRRKANREDVDAKLGRLTAQVEEFRSLLAKHSYDVAQALGSLAAVHRRIDEQGKMLESNTRATFEIARAVGAKTNGDHS